MSVTSGKNMRNSKELKSILKSYDGFARAIMSSELRVILIKLKAINLLKVQCFFLFLKLFSTKPNLKKHKDIEGASMSLYVPKKTIKFLLI